MQNYQNKLRKVSPEEIEKLRKLNTTLWRLADDLLYRSLRYRDAKQIVRPSRVRYKIKLSSPSTEFTSAVYDNYNIDGAMCDDGYEYKEEHSYIEKRLLKGDHPCAAMSYFLFATPLTIDDLLSINKIYTRIDVVADFMQISLDEPLHRVFDEKLKLYGYANVGGEITVPFQFCYAYNYRNGLAEVKLNGKWGFINQQGEVVAEIKYDECSNFSDGLAYVLMVGYKFINVCIPRTPRKTS